MLADSQVLVRPWGAIDAAGYGWWRSAGPMTASQRGGKARLGHARDARMSHEIIEAVLAWRGPTDFHGLANGENIAHKDSARALAYRHRAQFRPR